VKDFDIGILLVWLMLEYGGAFPSFVTWRMGSFR
jgi:hypothetical protein